MRGALGKIKSLNIVIGKLMLEKIPVKKFLEFFLILITHRDIGLAKYDPASLDCINFPKINDK